MSTELLTADDVAVALNLSAEQVKLRTKTDRWPCVKFSTHTIRYRHEHLEQIVAMYDKSDEVAPATGIKGQTARSRAKAS